MNFVSCKLCRFNNVRWAPIQRHPLMSESGLRSCPIPSASCFVYLPHRLVFSTLSFLK
jgi:hypothetical protein